MFWSSPVTCNYPWSSTAAGLWTLHTSNGWNIQLHFLDFDVEAASDIVEVRDGAGPNSTLLGEDVFYPESFWAPSSPGARSGPTKRSKTFI